MPMPIASTSATDDRGPHVGDQRAPGAAGGLVEVGPAAAGEQADQPQPDRAAVLEEEEQREQRQQDAGDHLAHGRRRCSAHPGRSRPGWPEHAVSCSWAPLVELALGDRERAGRRSPAPGRCPRSPGCARSPNPAVNRLTTSVMIPATTPSPTSSMVIAARDRGQPRRTSPAAPGCSRAASSSATITGTTTTALPDSAQQHVERGADDDDAATTRPRPCAARPGHAGVAARQRPAGQRRRRCRSRPVPAGRRRGRAADAAGSAVDVGRAGFRAAQRRASRAAYAPSTPSCRDGRPVPRSGSSMLVVVVLGWPVVVVSGQACGSRSAAGPDAFACAARRSVLGPSQHPAPPHRRSAAGAVHDHGIATGGCSRGATS